MSKYVYAQTNFSKGELGPKSLGNVTSEEYVGSVALMENFVPHPNGGAFKRPGTVYNGVTGRSTTAYMIPFISSDGKRFIITVTPSGNHDSVASDIVGFFNIDTGAYVTSYTVGYIGTTPRIGRLTICKSLDVYGFNYAQSGNVVVVTHASGLLEPIVIKYVGDDSRFSATNTFIWSFWSQLTAFSAELNVQASVSFPNVPYVDRNVSAITLTPDVLSATTITASTFFFTGSMIGSFVRIANATSEGVARILATNLTQTATVDLPNNQLVPGVNYTTGDEIVITGTSYIPTPLQSGKTYYAINVNATTCRVAYTRDDALANNYIILGAPSALGTVYVTSNIPATIATVATIIAFPAASASDNWTISAFSNYMGWPKTCAFFEGRLIFGGTNKNSGAIYASLLNNVFFFMQERLKQDYQAEDVEKAGTAITGSIIPYKGYLKVSDPFSFVIASNESNAIKWLNSGKNLFIGTVAGEGIITGGDQILSYNNVRVNFFTSVGSSAVQPKKIDQSLIFVALNGQGVRDFIFFDSNGSYVAVDLCALNDQIVHHNHSYISTGSKVQNRFVQMAFDSTNSILWMITNRFQLVGLSYNRQTNTMAWHKHTIGGNNVQVLGICVIHDAASNYNKLVLQVSRSLISTTRTFEYLNFNFEENITNQGFMSYLDCSMSGTVNAGGIGLNKASGFAPLINSTVSLTVEGKQHPLATVGAGGIITLSKNFINGSQVIAGFLYTSKIKLNPIQAGGDFGLSLGTLHRTDRVTVRLFKTLGLKYSWNDSSFDELFDNEDYTVDNIFNLNLFTGEKTEYVDNDHTTYNQISFQHDIPFPCNILNITQRGVSYGG